MARVSLHRRVAVELLQKLIPPDHFPPSSSGDDRPLKVPKLNENRFSKGALKKKKQQEQHLQNQQPLTEYIIEGKEAWGPYRECGYNENGENPDPNSSRSKNKERGKGAKAAKVQKAKAKATV